MSFGVRAVGVTDSWPRRVRVNPIREVVALVACPAAGVVVVGVVGVRRVRVAPVTRDARRRAVSIGPVVGALPACDARMTIRRAARRADPAMGSRVPDGTVADLDIHTGHNSTRPRPSLLSTVDGRKAKRDPGSATTLRWPIRGPFVSSLSGQRFRLAARVTDRGEADGRDALSTREAPGWWVPRAGPGRRRRPPSRPVRPPA